MSPTIVDSKNFKALFEASRASWTELAEARTKADEADEDLEAWLRSLGKSQRRVRISGIATGRVHPSTIQPVNRYFSGAIGTVEAAWFYYNDRYSSKEEKIQIRLDEGVYEFRISGLELDLVDE